MRIGHRLVLLLPMHRAVGMLGQDVLQPVQDDIGIGEEGDPRCWHVVAVMGTSLRVLRKAVPSLATSFTP